MIKSQSLCSGYIFNMTFCVDESSLLPFSSLHWSDLMFVLAATCTATVVAVLNLGLLASVFFAGVAMKHQITVQLCICGMFSCAALSCHIRFIWKREESSIQLPYSITCRTLDVVTLFSHCSFVTLTLLELRFPHRKAVIPLLSTISWCVTVLVSLTNIMHCSMSSAILLFCFYVLHIPLVVILFINLKSSCAIAPLCRKLAPLSRSVAPLGVVELQQYTHSVRRCMPQIILFFIITMPQAFLGAMSALKLKPFPSTEAWCCLMTSLFVALRPLLDTFFQPELGDAVVVFMSSLCRRKLPT